jgi:hypothetical protein
MLPLAWPSLAAVIDPTTWLSSLDLIQTADVAVVRGEM